MKCIYKIKVTFSNEKTKYETNANGGQYWMSEGHAKNKLERTHKKYRDAKVEMECYQVSLVNTYDSEQILLSESVKKQRDEWIKEFKDIISKHTETKFYEKTGIEFNFIKNIADNENTKALRPDIIIEYNNFTAELKMFNKIFREGGVWEQCLEIKEFADFVIEKNK